MQLRDSDHLRRRLAPARPSAPDNGAIRLRDADAPFDARFSIAGRRSSALRVCAVRCETSGVSTDLRLAFQLADIADAITLKSWSPSGIRSTTKADGSPVTEADIAAEQAMRTHLLASCPDDGFVGEEIGEIIGTSGRRWIVDGIDGTRFFVTGQRTWGTLIALELEGAVLVGVSSSPVEQRRWWATRGGGTFASHAVNGSAAVRLRVSRSRAVRPGRVATLPGFDRMAADQQHIIEGLLGAPASDRTWSHQNQVASGDLDACIWFGGDLWDHAAPSILVEEAGGRFTNHQGTHRLDTRSGHLP